MFILTVSVSLTVSVKVYHCVNGNRLFDGQIEFRTHSDRQTDCHYVHNVNLTDGDGDSEGDGTCKQALNIRLSLSGRDGRSII